MATQYSGFATKKQEIAYGQFVSKGLEMLSEKIIFMSGSKEFLSDHKRAILEDERTWSKRLLKLYRALRQFEKRKYSGGAFSSQLRQLVCFFAVKHMVGFEKDNDCSSIAAKSNLDEVLSQHGEDITTPTDIQKLHTSTLSASPAS